MSPSDRFVNKPFPVRRGYSFEQVDRLRSPSHQPELTVAVQSANVVALEQYPYIML